MPSTRRVAGVRAEPLSQRPAGRATCKRYAKAAGNRPDGYRAPAGLRDGVHGEL